MKNLIIFLSTFTLTVLLVVFTSAPANALTIPAVDGQCLAGWTLNSSGSCTSNSTGNGAGGSWDCPDGWTTKPDGSCSFDGGGGSGGGSGGGGSWGQTCKAVIPSGATDIMSACRYQVQSAYNNPSFIVTGYEMHPNGGSYRCFFNMPTPTNIGWFSGASCAENNEPPPFDPPPPPPPFPDLPPPPEDGQCNVCAQLYNINLKLNQLKNQDLTYIYQTVADMRTVVNNIDNSITSLNVQMNTVNNSLTNIDNSLGDVITNIENNNITQNEIKNEITNIYETMNDYALELGDIKLALGDIDVDLDNTNKLVLDLGLDIDWIKNNLVNGSPDSKDYTEQLNQIIELLKSCEPTAEKPCPDDEVLKKLKEIQDFMEADFVPDTDSTAVEVEDLTDIELDRNLIKFGVAQCPPDNEFSTMVNGFSFSGGFKHKPLCDFFTLLSPFIKAFGGFSAALILGGGLRRG